MYTEVTVVRGAVQAEVDTKGNGCPRRVVLATIKACLNDREASDSRQY